MKLFIFITFSLIINCYPQYQIPINTFGNEINLNIINDSNQNTKYYKILVNNPPDWLNFIDTECNLTAKPFEKNVASFTFDVGDNAPINKNYSIGFMITDEKGQNYYKLIDITITKPYEFKLFQNYPNPFNPETIISYELPSEAKVNLSIYNILGERVVELVNETKSAGHYEITFNASAFASGTYFYCLKTNTHSSFKKLILLK